MHVPTIYVLPGDVDSSPRLPLQLLCGGETNVTSCIEEMAPEPSSMKYVNQWDASVLLRVRERTGGKRPTRHRIFGMKWGMSVEVPGLTRYSKSLEENQVRARFGGAQTA